MKNLKTNRASSNYSLTVSIDWEVASYLIGVGIFVMISALINSVMYLFLHQHESHPKILSNITTASLSCIVIGIFLFMFWSFFLSKHQRMTTDGWVTDEVRLGTGRNYQLQRLNQLMYICMGVMFASTAWLVCVAVLVPLMKAD